MKLITKGKRTDGRTEELVQTEEKANTAKRSLQTPGGILWVFKL